MAKDCLKYGKNTYKPEILFNKIRNNADFFAKKHGITGFDIEKALGISVVDSGNSEVEYSKIDLKNGAKKLISDLFNMVKTNQVKAKPHSIGVFNNVAKDILSKVSGLSFRESTEVVVNPSELRHIYNDHYGENEKDKGSNIPLTDSDVMNVADVISEPDKVAFIGKDDRTGLNIFLFAKKSSNGTFIVAKAYGNTWGKMSLKSLYHSRKNIDKVIKDELTSALSTPEIDSGVLAQRVADINSSNAKIENLIDFTTEDIKKSLDEEKNNIDFHITGNTTPLPYKNLIPAKTLQAITADAKTNGTTSARKVLNDSNWYKNLSAKQKTAVDGMNIKDFIIDQLGKINENIQAKATQKNKGETDSPTEYASEYDRKNKLITERIKPTKRSPINPVRKLNEIIKDLGDELKATIIYGKSGRRNTLGTYNPSNTLIRITNAGDLDTVAHEVGHWLDDHFDLLGTIPNADKLLYDREIEWFAERGGSNPPNHLKDKAKKLAYLQREGIAEFVRAYMVNPKNAKRIAPNFFAHFEQSIDEKTLGSIKKFGDAYLDISNATAGDRMTANVDTNLNPEKKKLFEFLKKTDTFGFNFWDKINVAVFDVMAKANKSFAYINKLSEKSDILPENDFRILHRLFAGVDGKINSILQNGLVDGKNNLITDTDGSPMTVSWLLDVFDTTSEETIKNDMEESIRFLIAERTVEYAKKFGRTDQLTGFGAGIDSDFNVATEYLNEFESLKTENEEKYKRIKEAARRYRAYADAGLRYAVDKGRISKEMYDKIKETNEYYVNLTRIKETSPKEEIDEAFFGGGNMTSVKQILKKAKGGTDMIRNPYESLLTNTANMIKESDRNEIMVSFITPLKEIREMGDGTPVNFAQIARPAKNGDKNVKRFFINGVEEKWQFSNDTIEAFNALDGMVWRFYKWVKSPADLIRFTVTKFPIFALRNTVRDTTSRLVSSRTNNNIKSLITNITDMKYKASEEEMFDLYGGSLGGYYSDKNAYKKYLRDAITGLSKQKNTSILSYGKKALSAYNKGLELSEKVNRMAEFKSAYRKYKADGMDDYNAHLMAAFEARDLMDFALGGRFAKIANQIIPFFNAGIQGLVRTKKNIQERPLAWAVKTAVYTVLPTLLQRMIVSAMGDDDEYEELPAFQRDLFWNFRTPWTGNYWISIPKPYDNGLISALVDRGISYAKGNKDAFNGVTGSVAKTLIPVDESSWMGSLKPIVEAGIFNYDTFRDKEIVPFYEVDKMRELRKSDQYASVFSKKVTDFLYENTDWDINPNKLDHVIKGYTTYMGDWGLSGIDHLSGEDRRRWDWAVKSGFARDIPIANAKSVSEMKELAIRTGQSRSSDLKPIFDNIKKFYDAKDPAERRKLSGEIYKESKEAIIWLKEKEIKMKKSNDK